MPHETIWIVENRVLLSTFTGNVTAEELQGFIEEVRQKIDEGTPLVHHISDSLQLEKVEFSLASAKLLTSAVKLLGRLGWQVDINRNRLNQMFAGLASQFAGVRSRTFATMQEAVDFLKDNDPTLETLEWKLIPPAEDTTQDKTA